jgi:glutaredoxin
MQSDRESLRHLAFTYIHIQREREREKKAKKNKGTKKVPTKHQGKGKLS